VSKSFDLSDGVGGEVKGGEEGTFWAGCGLTDISGTGCEDRSDVEEGGVSDDGEY